MRPIADLNKASTLVATSAKSKVRCRRQPGKHMLVLSLTRFDPNRTYGQSVPCTEPQPHFRVARALRRMLTPRLSPTATFLM